MGPTNFPSGFAAGLTVRGLPLLQAQPGTAYWLGNSSIITPGCVGGSDNNNGTFQKPFGTLLGALAKMTHGAGDILFIKPGHYEVISSATIAALNCAGVAIIGLGGGDMRPTFNFTTATTANIQLRAARMALQNCVFLANFADIASFITAVTAQVTASIAGNLMTVTAVGSGTVYPGASVNIAGVTPNTIVLRQVSGTTGGIGVYQVNNSQTVASGTVNLGTQDFSLESCEFRDSSSILNALTVFTASGTANMCDGLRIVCNRVKSLGTTAATTAIKTTVAIDRLTISGNFGVSAILNDTAGLLAAGAAQLTMFDLSNNRWTRPNTSSTGGSFVSGTGNAWTGMASNNLFSQADATTGIWISTGHGTAFGYQLNYSNITFAADTSALINPAAA
jgi:hypothetical protein